MNKSFTRANGFSLIELLIAALIFTIVAGGVFSVLMSSQLRYQSDSGLTTAFQQANLVMDQITRDIHSAGYPPSSSFNSTVTQNSSNWYLFAVAFPWSPNYPGTVCTVGTCVAPGDDDLILEEDLGNGNGVQWIRYKLDGTTLKRGVTKKAAGDPGSAPDLALTAMLPYLENVVNPSGTPIFQYFDHAGGSAVNPSNIYEVNVRLIVQSATTDPQTGKRRTITVTGQAVRFNSN
jgi:prepilin-type N-terminal cleavage/methylation domain-containing protein